MLFGVDSDSIFRIITLDELIQLEKYLGKSMKSHIGANRPHGVWADIVNYSREDVLKICTAFSLHPLTGMEFFEEGISLSSLFYEMIIISSLSFIILTINRDWITTNKKVREKVDAFKKYHAVTIDELSSNGQTSNDITVSQTSIVVFPHLTLSFRSSTEAGALWRGKFDFSIFSILIFNFFESLDLISCVEIIVSRKQ